MQYILGIRPQYGGLEIDPCIPKAWGGFTVRRTWRGADYMIEVSNPDHVSKGVKKIILDGHALKGHILPILSDEKSHTVQVLLGA